jgi:neutral ceramidase
VNRRVWILLLAAGCASPGGPASEPLRVGAAEVDITPPKGYRMSGYFYERLNTGIKDPLKAKAIVFEQGDTRAALVFCDLSGVPLSVTSRAREVAERRTGVPAARIGIAATHTHTGPLYFGAMAKILHERAAAAQGRDPQDFDYASFLSGKIAESIERAAATLRPGGLGAGIIEENGLSFNRRYHMKDGTVRTNPGSLNPEIVNAAGPIDPEIAILSVQAGGRRIAALTVFALHCDTTGGTEYSADYPYFLERELRASLGADFISAFGAGTCGNINHLDVTRKERRSAKDLGVALGQDVLSGLPKLTPVAPALAMRSSCVPVPLQTRTPDAVAFARANVARIGAQDTPFLDQVRIATTLHLEELPPVLSLEVQVLRLGRDTAIVTLPGEIFVELGLAIKRQSPFAHTFVVELANDNPAYVPTRAAFVQGAYEVENSRVAPGGGERLVEEALRLLKELAK